MTPPHRAPSTSEDPRSRLSRLARSSRERPAAIAFAIALGVALIVALAQGEKGFVHDSGGYWSLSEKFVRDGRFSLFDFYDPLRGYALPLFYWALRNTAEMLDITGSLAVRALNAGLFAAIGAVLAPRLAAITWPRQSWSVSRRLVLCGLLLLFWAGYLSYPLSDFPAFTLALLALVAIARSDSWPWLLVAGLSAGLAINFRPAYALLAPLLVLLVAWSWIERRGADEGSVGRRALGAAALLAGLAIVSVPQSIVQHRNFGEITPLPGGSDLSGIQYRYGLGLQRYETHLEGPMPYVETHTTEILAEHNYPPTVGPDLYLEIILDHPATMAGLALRHLVNGFDQRNNTPYVETLEAERTGFESAWHLLLRVFGFLLVFLALVRVTWPAGRRSLGAARWRYMAALIGVVALAAMPAAIETRYMIAAWVVAWMLVVAPGWRKALEEIRAGPYGRGALVLALSAGAIIYAVVVWSIVSATTDSLRLS